MLKLPVSKPSVCKPSALATPALMTSVSGLGMFEPSRSSSRSRHPHGVRPVPAMPVRSPAVRAPELLALAVAALLLSGCDQRPSPATGGVAPADVAAAPVAGADTSTAAPAPRAQFRASGNEPFWAVQVDGGSLVWTTPEMQPGKRLTVQQTTDAGGMRFFGKDGTVDFSFEVTPGECQDSMSGKMFEYSAAFIHGDEKMTGCAREGLQVGTDEESAQPADR